MHHGAQLLMWVRGIQTQILVFFQQAPYPQNSAPQPESALYKAFKLARDSHTNQWALGTLHEQIVIGSVVPTYTGIAEVSNSLFPNCHRHYRVEVWVSASFRPAWWIAPSAATDFESAT